MIVTVDQSIARIRQYAEAKEWTKTRLAIEAGINTTTLRDFNSEDWSPTVNTIRRLEAIIPPDWVPAEQTAS